MQAMQQEHYDLRTKMFHPVHSCVYHNQKSIQTTKQMLTEQGSEHFYEFGGENNNLSDTSEVVIQLLSHLC